MPLLGTSSPPFSMGPLAFTRIRDAPGFPCSISPRARYYQPVSTRFVASQTTLSPSQPTPLPAASESKEVASKPAAGLPSLPYHVHRTAFQELPIYHLAKRGGNLHQTRIRKIEGDVAKLRDELQATLKLKKEHAVINQVTGHIILKGWYKDEVKSFLQARRF